MKLLLDTHVLLWWLSDAPELAHQHRALIADRRNTVLVSSITSAEIAIKSSLGKLEVPDGIASILEESGFEELPFTSAHATELHDLPWHHRDPLDRMLICQARVEHATFVTADPACRAYDVDTR